MLSSVSDNAHLILIFSLRLHACSSLLVPMPLLICQLLPVSQSRYATNGQNFSPSERKEKSTTLKIIFINSDILDYF
jgi:hypothetical protein